MTGINASGVIWGESNTNNIRKDIAQLFNLDCVETEIHTVDFRNWEKVEKTLTFFEVLDSLQEPTQVTK